MKSKNDVEVLINGRKYTICGFESAEYLQKVATYINEKYSEFKNRDYYYSLDMDLRNILLAVNIADDYFKRDKEYKAIQKDNESKDKMVLDMKHEVLQCQNESERVIQRNNELKQGLEEAEKKLVGLNVKNQDNAEKVRILEEKLRRSEADNSANAAKYETAQERVDKLETENTRLKKRVDTLGDKVKSVESEKGEQAKLKTENTQLQKRVDTLSDKVKSMESEKAEQQAKLEAAEKRIADLESRNRRGKR